MANFDTMTVVGTGAAKSIVDDLKADSFVRSTGPTQFITAMKITPWSTNSGPAAYWGRANVTTEFGDRLVKGIATHVDWDGGSISVNDVYMAFDVGGDKASIAFTLA